MRKVLEACPSCGGELAITRMGCMACDTVVISQYQPCRFCRLPETSLEFLEVFIKSRGNVKEMERETGFSYWHIRNRLNELLEELGFEIEPESEEETSGFLRRKEILEQLDRGEIDADRATEMLADIDAPD